VTTHHQLLDDLTTAGHLSSAWRDAFAAVDRGLFIPAHAWFDDEHGNPQPLDRDTDPAGWRAAVYSDEPVVTQLNGGKTVWPQIHPRITSSASQPRIVAVMLDALEVREGNRVLEIGTGTGYNAALLAQRLGDNQVITIEVDPVLTDQARTNLAAAGYKPTVICGDGATGWADGAPYDRVVSTAAVIAGQLPYAWVEQTRAGGLILTPWGTAYRNGVLARLTAHGDGTASGSFIGDAAFMRLRDQQLALGEADRLGDLIDNSDIPAQTTPVPPWEVSVDADGTFAVGLALHDHVRCGAFYNGDAEHYEVLLYHGPTDSAASVQVTPEHTAAGQWPVRQLGPRRLWDEVEAAHARWDELGRPVRSRYGLTVTADRQLVWLDDPTNMVVTLT
jgi:protein-L-isoaspartate(D-aspartate) O-methyltransferase